MNAVVENIVGILMLLAVTAAFAGPSLAFNRRERAIDRQLRAAERGEYERAA